MINITNIKGGWLDLHIGDKTFTVSYLTDASDELDKILTLNEDKIKLLYFDGEGKDLYLTIRKEYDDIIIIWEELSDNVYLYRLEYNYEKFKQEWLRLWITIQEDYWKNFNLSYVHELDD